MTVGKHSMLVEIKADVADADKKIGKLEKEVEKLKNALARAKGESDQAKKKIDALGEGIKGAAKGFETFNKLIGGAGAIALVSRFSGAMTELADRAQRVTGAADENVRSVRQMNTEWEATSNILAARAMPIIGDAARKVIELLDAVENVTGGFDSFEGVLESAVTLMGTLLPPTDLLSDALLKLRGAIDDTPAPTQDLRLEFEKMKMLFVGIPNDVQKSIDKLNEIAELGRRIRLENTSDNLALGDAATEQGPLLGYSETTKRKRGKKKKKPDFLTGLFGKKEADRMTSEFGYQEEGAAQSFKDELFEEDVRANDLARMNTEATLAEVEARASLRDARAESLSLIEQENIAAENEMMIHESRTAALEETFDREIEMATARGEMHDAQVLRLQKEMELANEQNRHATALVTAENKRNAAKEKSNRDTWNAVVQATGTAATALDKFAEQGGRTGEAFARAAAFARGLQAMAVGAQTFAEGVADIASFNYVKGAAEIAAGIMNISVGGLLMAGDITGAAGKAGSGAGGAGGMSPSGGLGAQRTYAQGPSSQIPASPNGSAPGGTQKPANGGGNTYNVTVNQTGTVDRESATKIKQGLEELDYSRGRVSA